MQGAFQFPKVLDEFGCSVGYIEATFGLTSGPGAIREITPRRGHVEDYGRETVRLLVHSSDTCDAYLNPVFVTHHGPFIFCRFIFLFVLPLFIS